MAVFPRPVGPRAALADLLAVIRQPGRERLIGAALAILVTIIIVIEFLVDPQINTAPPQQIIYVQQWKADRTDAQIKADQKVDQAARLAAKKEKQRQFQKLAKDLGID